MISRRKLFAILAADGALAAVESLLPVRAIFLPPTGGWPFSRVYMALPILSDGVPEFHDPDYEGGFVSAFRMKDGVLKNSSASADWWANEDRPLANHMREARDVQYEVSPEHARRKKRLAHIFDNYSPEGRFEWLPV